MLGFSHVFPNMFSPMFDPAKTHQYGSYVPWSPFMVGLGYGHPMKLRLLDAHFSCSKSASWGYSGYRFAPSEVMQVGSSKLAGSATPQWLQKSSKISYLPFNWNASYCITVYTCYVPRRICMICHDTIYFNATSQHMIFCSSDFGAVAPGTRVEDK